ncbi:DUF6477 family protein [Albidovulum sp.]
MHEILSAIARRSRPKLLIRAARAGLPDYDRNRDLKRLMRTDIVPTPERALTLLLAEEERLDRSRRAGDATYSFARHIEFLIALMAELRLLPQMRPEG